MLDALIFVILAVPFLALVVAFHLGPYAVIRWKIRRAFASEGQVVRITSILTASDGGSRGTRMREYRVRIVTPDGEARRYAVEGSPFGGVRRLYRC